MKQALIAFAEDTLACALSAAALVVLALTLGAVWHTGMQAALITAVSGALLAYLLVWARVPSGLSPLLAQCLGAVLCVRLAASIPLLPANHVLFLHENTATPLTAWLVDLVDRTVGPERAVFLLLLFLLWEVAYTMVWLVLRERWAWAGGGMAGASLVAGAGAAGTIGDQVVVFAVVALALVLWTTSIDDASRWRRARASVAPRVRSMVLTAGVATLLLAGTLAWTLVTPARVAGGAAASPGERLSQLVRLWQQTSHRLASSLPSSMASQVALLGQGGPLSLDRPFTPRGRTAVLVSGAVPADWASMYWRSVVYDTYNGGTWQPASGTTKAVPAGALLETAAPGQRIVTLRYRLLDQPGGSALVSAGRLLSLDLPALTIGNSTGLLAVLSTSASADYTASSTWPSGRPPAALPRESWGSADLAMPPGSRGLTMLAREVTAGATGPADQAAALQSYLRTSFTYDTSVGAPPAGQDPISYFVFINRRGYCTHFASAMVMLARALGLPARLVGGYAGGASDSTAGPGVTLRDSDAHTWPELYLPGQGWTLYEPTPGFARPPGLPASAPRVQSSAPVLPRRAGSHPSTVPQNPAHAKALLPPRVPDTTAVPIVLLLALVGAVIGGLRWRAQRRQPRAAQVALLYGRMSRLVSPAPHPAETARHFARRVARHDALTGPDALWLAALYERVCYGRGVPSLADVRQARATVARLRRLWLLRHLRLRRPSAL